MKNSLRHSGFTLVEVLIVTAAIGGLAMVGMQLTKNMSKTTVKANFDSETLLITNEINGILSDPLKCKTVFGITANPINIGKYYTKSSGAAPAQGYGNGGIDINSFQLTTTGNEGLLKIAFINKSILKGVSGSSDVTKKINLYVEGTAGAISKCRSISSASSDIWTRGTGPTNSNDIYYTQGNVGVGVTTPQTALHVSGEITSQGGSLILQRPVTTGGWARGIMYTPDGDVNPTGNGLGGIGMYGLSAAQNDIFLTFGAAPWSSTTGMHIKSNGNVGIGDTNPAKKLTIASSAAADGILLHGGANGGEISSQDDAHFNVNNGRTTTGTISMPHYGIAFPNTPGAAETWMSGYSGVSLYTGGTERMRIDNGGNIGVGTASPTAKLDVSGEIKIGNTSSACSGASEGHQRYNSTTKQMEFCNGTAWTQMGGGGITCVTKSLAGGNYHGVTLSCDAGYTMTGGGCGWRSDGNDNFVYSFPSGNGWYCADYDYALVNQIYVRCCK